MRDARGMGVVPGGVCLAAAVAIAFWWTSLAFVLFYTFQALRSTSLINILTSVTRVFFIDRVVHEHHSFSEMQQLLVFGIQQPPRLKRMIGSFACPILFECC